MNKRYLQNIIKNYHRNKKRIEEIRRDYYSISGINYSNFSSGTPESHDNFADKVHKFQINEERIVLQKEIDAVDRALLKLNEKDGKIYDLFYNQKRNIKYIENIGYSKSTIFRSLKRVLRILEDELKIGEDSAK